jgi:hypothetical protein
MNLKQNDIRELIEKYNEMNNPESRFCSFDYCYNYFHTNAGEQMIKDIEKSCLVIGFYLASWGMLRGSSFLLQKSAKFFEPLIRYFSKLEKNFWDIDVNSYDHGTPAEVVAIYHGVKENVIGDREVRQITLITKILLGVFGFIPAFDTNFIETFKFLSNGKYGFTSVNSGTLGFIHQFYLDNQTDIDTLSREIQTVDFRTGKSTGIYYTKAKIIDMYGWMKGEQIQNGTSLLK